MAIATRTTKILVHTYVSPTDEMDAAHTALQRVAVSVRGLSRSGMHREVGHAMALQAGLMRAEVSTNSYLANCMARVGVFQAMPSYNKMGVFT